MSATFYVTTGGSDTYWRVELPARFLGGKVTAVPEEQYKVFVAPHDFEPFPWSATDGGDFTYPSHEGAAVWTRPDLNRAHHIVAMQQRGILTCAEVDDNHLSRTSLNLFMRVHGYDDEGRKHHLTAMGAADRVIVTTRWLRDTYHKAFKKAFGYEQPIFIARNHCDLDDWPERIPSESGRLRIGWMGSPQHYRDIMLAMPALTWARQAGHEIVLMGHDVRDKTGVTNPKALLTCDAWRALITRYIPWQPPAEYHRSALPFDIGIAPLELNDHTLGKSDVKAIEYTMSGAVSLLQSHPVYAKEWRHNETCLLANHAQEFVYQLKALCESRRLRERLLSGAEQYVREERSNKVATREWQEAIDAR